VNSRTVAMPIAVVLDLVNGRLLPIRTTIGRPGPGPLKASFNPTEATAQVANILRAMLVLLLQRGKPR
jgi:hypothetical protein